MLDGNCRRALASYNVSPLKIPILTCCNHDSEEGFSLALYNKEIGSCSVISITKIKWWNRTHFCHLYICLLCKYTERERSHQFEQHFPIWKLLGKLQGTEELQFTLELIGVPVRRGKISCPFTIGICLPWAQPGTSHIRKARVTANWKTSAFTRFTGLVGDWFWFS